MKILNEGGYFVVVCPKVPRCCSEFIDVYLFDRQGYFVMIVSKKFFEKLWNTFKVECESWLVVHEVGSVFSYYRTKE